MGYCITLMYADVLISLDREDEALESIKDYTKGKTYGWVSDDEVQSAETLQDVLQAFRFDTSVGEVEGFRSIDHFNGEKHNESVEFGIGPALAGIAHGSLEWLGEDGERWRDVWDGIDGTYRQQNARIVWE